MKRVFDILIAAPLLVAMSPIILSAMTAVWLYDRHAPIYWANRVGKNNCIFRMAKIRSMRIDAERIGGTSTSGNDNRITPVGRVIRRFKLDELSQLWNVLRGDMHLVGPRPNTPKDVSLYSQSEMKLLDVKPGITDLSSIVFSDEGAILYGSNDPDELYNRIIRPWKSQLGLLYIEHQSLWLDQQIVILTFVALFSRPLALSGVHRILIKIGAPRQLIDTCLRNDVLQETVPPGIDPKAATTKFSTNGR